MTFRTQGRRTHINSPACDLQAARTDKVSTRQNGSGPSSNGASLSEDSAVHTQHSSNGSSNGVSADTVVTGTDLQERPYSNNGNGASLNGNASSYAQQGSPAQRRETAVADTLQETATEEAQPDTGPPRPQHSSQGRSNYTEADIAPQSSAAQQQQEAAVQAALRSPKAQSSGSDRWSRVGKYSTIQVSPSFASPPL